MGHTPGPWRAVGSEVVWLHCPGDQCVVADVLYEEYAADARLIAAAPELLAVLRELVHYDEGSSEQGSYGYEVLLRCKAAIAKAEGRSE